MPRAVSIIMPCYNAATHLSSSLGSVLAQTYSDWELIAIDDGSTDDTLQKLRSQSDPRIRVLAQSNAGVSAARNAGLGAANGNWIAFLDADDTWAPEFLAKMLGALDARLDAVLAYCGWRNVGVAGPRGEPFVPPDYETPEKAELLFSACRWPIHAVVARRDAVVAAKGFDTTLQNAEDFALWLRVATRAPIVRVPEVLAFYHFHGGAHASAHAARAALQHLQAQRQFLSDDNEFQRRLGAARAREIMLSQLLQKGYVSYWQRDLSAARMIFRAVMKRGYGTLSDWKYMLPAWLPESLHRGLIDARNRR